MIVADQSLFADELSTYWISATHSLGGVISLMYGTDKIPHAEITPPLYFVASWFTTQFGHSPELLRLPSLVAGALTLPVVYLLGLRTVGRPAALLATAVTALSPFMIYYSAEARSYSVMMFFVATSTLAMLLAVDTRRTRWWVLYAVCSCAAIYTHYTCGFVLLVQFVWLVWAHPDLRRAVVLANLGVIVGLLPWATGLINDFHSPTTQILSALSPFTFDYMRLSFEHWALGFPYVNAGGLGALPGTVAMVLLGLAAVVAVIGAATQLDGLRAWIGRLDRRILLIFALALAAPVGELRPARSARTSSACAIWPHRGSRSPSRSRCSCSCWPARGCAWWPSPCRSPPLPSRRARCSRPTSPEPTSGASQTSSPATRDPVMSSSTGRGSSVPGR